MRTEEARSRLLLGAVCVVAGAVMFALAGVAIKFASDSLSSESIVFWRSVISMAILMPWALARRSRWFRPDNMALIGLRAGTIVLSLYCYYYAVSVIPLADAVLLLSSSPIFVPLLGLLLFRFPLDRRALLAVLAGFLGVLLILQPGVGTVSPGAVFGLLAGLFGAIGVVVVWRMPAQEDPARIAFFLALVSAIVFAMPTAMAGDWPTGGDWLPLLALGVFSTVAHLLFAFACLVAPADRIITLEYSTVVFAAVLGWLIWGEQPDLLFVAGGILVVGAAVYVVRVRGRAPLSTRSERSTESAVAAMSRATSRSPVTRWVIDKVLRFAARKRARARRSRPAASAPSPWARRRAW